MREYIFHFVEGFDLCAALPGKFKDVIIFRKARYVSFPEPPLPAFYRGTI